MKLTVQSLKATALAEQQPVDRGAQVRGVQRRELPVELRVQVQFCIRARHGGTPADRSGPPLRSLAEVVIYGFSASAGRAAAPSAAIISSTRNCKAPHRSRQPIPAMLARAAAHQGSGPERAMHEQRQVPAQGLQRPGAWSGGAVVEAQHGERRPHRQLEPQHPPAQRARHDDGATHVWPAPRTPANSLHALRLPHSDHPRPPPPDHALEGHDGRLERGRGAAGHGEEELRHSHVGRDLLVLAQQPAHHAWLLARATRAVLRRHHLRHQCAHACTQDSCTPLNHSFSTIRRHASTRLQTQNLALCARQLLVTVGAEESIA